MKNLDSRIKALQEQLNSVDCAPARGYRRNITVYSLVSYVNNITGCYISKNLQMVELFIARARAHMDDFPASEQWSSYYRMVDEYLFAMEEWLNEIGLSQEK
jgi:hypothetical protein